MTHVNITMSNNRLVYMIDDILYRKAAAAGVDETQYVFLKRVCQVLVELGTSQIARLWVCCTLTYLVVYVHVH